MDYIAQVLTQAPAEPIDYLRLDGSTDIQKRQQIVNQFNLRHTRARVFLLSSRAGGVGLNITGIASL